MSKRPLVGVVTPVYNGGRYLRECIDSVLAQTYDNWQYTILDNCSIDGTSEIADEYAARDPRIRVYRNPEVLPIMQNWNAALGLMPAEAKYCKVVHADDTLFPECLERMTALAERHPTVAVVTSYALWGDEVRHLGVTYPVEVVDGREICRDTLLSKCYVFGSPSSILLRAADVRSRQRFYNEQNRHADTEACFDLLDGADLGFVHQILTRTRIHPDAETPASVRINTFHDAWLTMHMRYGPQCLDPEDYYALLFRRLRRYGIFLTKAAVKAKYRDPRFRTHHREAVGRVLQSLTHGGLAVPRRSSA
jgi:glycosyltransferase involved in cell wall biosynthesis